MRRHILLSVLAIALVHCGAAPAHRDRQADWRDVLRHKKAAVAAAATPQARQTYADALSAFVKRYPRHSRAREVYERIQLEFANELCSLERYQDAIRVYRAVLNDDPRSDEARRGLDSALARLAVTHDQLLTVEVGMSQKDVARILGKPVPGWTATSDRSSATIEAWYYRTTSGGIAAVYFREGEVFAAEEKSHARINL